MLKRSFKVVALGEILWDMLPAGKQLGGAPGNFGWHVQQLGGAVTMVSRVGNDELGKEALSRISRMGLKTEEIQRDDKAPTGQAVVELSASGSPTFRIVENVAWDFIEYRDSLSQQLEDVEVIYFGSLAQRSELSRSTIQKCLQEVSPEALRIFDINLRAPFYSDEVILKGLELANALKLNDQELPLVAQILNISGDVKTQIEKLCEKFNLKLAAFTRGAEGSLLFADGKWSEYKSQPVKVVDSVGAGDSFTAGLVTGYIEGKSLDAINEHANRIAAFVCTQAGATPVLPENLKS